jgi:hypothetical protein
MQKRREFWRGYCYYIERFYLFVSEDDDLYQVSGNIFHPYFASLTAG